MTLRSPLYSPRFEPQRVRVSQDAVSYPILGSLRQAPVYDYPNSAAMPTASSAASSRRLLSHLSRLLDCRRQAYFIRAIGRICVDRRRRYSAAGPILTSSRLLGGISNRDAILRPLTTSIQGGQFAPAFSIPDRLLRANSDRAGC